MINIRAIAVVAAITSFVVPVLAAQEGLVNVNVSNVANDLAKNLSVDVSQIPVTVQVPVGIAANICGVDANVLAQDKGANGATCEAKSTSSALNQQVQKALKK